MQTPFQIAFKNMPSSEFLEAHVSRRVTRLDSLRRDIIFCRVVLEAPNHSAEQKPPLAISIEVEVPRRTVVAKEVEQRHAAKHDTLAVINRAFDAVERQLEDDVRSKRPKGKRHSSDGDLGRIISVNPDQNFGLVEVKGSPNIHFNRTAVKNGELEDLEEGMIVRVTVGVGESPLGPQASSIRMIGREDYDRPPPRGEFARKDIHG
jgi:ribosome-associated translation inhibitor RaiA/cold shock CspA family protein